MRDRHDRDARLARIGVKKLARVERLAFDPGFEAGRGQQIVELHRQRKAVLLRKEGVQIHDADTLQRRVLNFRDQACDAQVAAGAPGMIEQLRNEDMFAAGYRIGVDAEQR